MLESSQRVCVKCELSRISDIGLSDTEVVFLNINVVNLRDRESWRFYVEI